jgi:hypothetical protein
MIFPSSNGLATNFSLTDPAALAFDNADKLYIGESSYVLGVDTNDMLTVLAGNGGPAPAGLYQYGGAATNAPFGDVEAVTVDSVGNYYIADNLDSDILAVDTNGIIRTLVGGKPYLGAYGFSGDGGASTNARIENPQGLAVDAIGNLYISANNRIRKVSFSNLPTLALSNVNTNNAGSYDVIVTSPSGSVTSRVVTLSVLQRPSISLAPGGITTLHFLAVPGQRMCVQTATNFGSSINWMSIFTNSADASGVLQFVDSNAFQFQSRFYRLSVP